MKTKMMVLEHKEGDTFRGTCEYVCGECYGICENQDTFCWSCGAEFVGQAYNREDFNKKS